MGGHDPRRSDEFETVADGAAAVKAVSDSAIPPPSSGLTPPPPSSDPMMTVDLGPDSPTLADAPRTSQSSFASALDQSSFPPGTVLGQRYEILETLGRGGMGAVYKARDREVNRIIALKVIRPDLAGNSSIIDRFKQELVLSHQVTHRNVVRIYDLGEADGVKFITMEYIEGSDLRSLIKERKAFPPGEAVEIMIQICRALEAAHSVGVIHRDLKPQNVMRDNQGRVVVMDFGLARLVESDGMTQTGALVGTMEYMSPEQALGSTLDQRSDLFTVGLIFYELLTGKMPFRADSALASLIKRTQERAAPVTTHDSTIPSVLANIVSKCMERDPKLRYQNAGELLQDLEAWQGKRAAATLHFPASARPWGQTIPWHWVGGIAAVLILAVAGFLLRQKLSSKGSASTGPVVSLAVLPFHNASGDPTADWLGSSIAEMLTTDVGQSAKVHVVSSDSMHQLLRDLKVSAATNLDDASIHRLGQLSNADRIVWGQYVKLGDEIRLDATVQDLKQQRSAHLKAEATNQQDVFAAVDRLAQGIRDNLALSSSVIQELSSQAFRPSTKSLAAMRDYNDGLELTRDGKKLDAVTKFESAVKEDPDFVLGYAKLGETYAKLGYGDKADDVSRKAVDLAQNLPAQERYRVLAIQALVSNDADKALQYYENLAKVAPEDTNVRLSLADLYKRKGSYDNAHDQLLRVLNREPSNAEALLAIADVEDDRSNPQSALEYLNRALTLAIQLDSDELRASILFETGYAYRLLNKPEEALDNYQKSLEIRRRLGDKAGVAQVLAEIAEIQHVQGNNQAAVARYKEAIGLQREIGDQAYLSHTLLNLGTVYVDMGHFDESLKYYKESLQMLRGQHDEDAEAMCLNNIGYVNFSTGRYDDAFAYYQQALQIREKQGSGFLPMTLYNLGDLSSRTGQYDQALAYYLRGVGIARNAADKRLIAMGSFSLGTVFDYQGRYGAELSADEEALKAYREIQDKTDNMAQALNGYGHTLTLLGRSKDAEKTLEEGLSLARELKDDPAIAQSLNFQGERLTYAGDFKGARPLFEQALLASTRSKDAEKILQAKLGLAELDVGEGDIKQAVPNLKRLVAQAQSLGSKYLSARCSLSLIEALISNKDYTQAQQSAETLRNTSEKFGFKLILAKSQYLLGEIFRLQNKSADAGRRYQDARQILEDIDKDAKSDGFLKRSDLAPIISAAAH
jgi:serine/threonine protein kinase/tetratricopeptide (TPR) repeat protein